MKYIKDGEYPNAEVGKYIYAVRQKQSREGRQYVRIQISVAHDVTRENWYKTPRGRCMKKEQKQLKLYNLNCVEPLLFGWLDQSTWQMDLTNDTCEVHKRRNGISLGMNPKWFADGRKCSEHNKQKNVIHFE